MTENTQNLKFRSVDEFLEFLPPQERKIVDELRKLVFDCLPECTEKLSYNVPYYALRYGVCFIWPASVQWKIVTQQSVDLGFCKGHLLTDDLNYLDKGKRKEVYVRTFYSVKDIDADLLRSFIYEAAIVDEQLAKSKKRH